MQKKIKELENLQKACIIISTQVIEVSLDIDFDIMITDCAPIDSLIQRFGRINHRRKHKTKPIHIIAPPYDSKDCLPYKKELLDKTYKILKNGNLYEVRIQSMIDSIYDTIDLKHIEPFLVLKNNIFTLIGTCHHPKSVLMEMLKINSVCCITQSDKEKYEHQKDISLEIPIAWRITKYKDFKSFGRTNTTIGFIPLNLKSCTEIYNVYNYLLQKSNTIFN